MTLIPGPLIPGPEPLRRRYGLLTAASGPMDLSPHGEGGGVRYEAVTCGEAFSYPIGCANDVVSAPTKRLDGGDPLVEALPFTVVASIECGSLGYTESEFDAKIRRRLANGEQGAVEQAFWTGNTPAGADLGIDNLQDSAVAVFPPDNTDIRGVVAGLEDYAYRAEGYGSVAYIHAPVSVAAWAANAYLIIEDGPLKRTPFGSIWVFGGGYPGTGANGAFPFAGGAYMHITGQVNVWRAAEVTTYPMSATLNRETNQMLLLAERTYAVGFDCLNGRAEFNPLGAS